MVLYAYAIIGHTRADQLLPQLLMEQFNTFLIQCRHIEHMHEGVWFRNKKRYDSELPYQRPDLIEVMEIEIDLTTSTNVHTSFYIIVRECLD